MIIEDNHLNMKLVRSMLKLAHYQVVEANDAESGILLAREHLPDLILMDIQLPGIDGLDATRIIKNEPNLKHIPVVALTSYAMKGDHQKAISAGCNGYIAKPIDTRNFLDILSDIWRHTEPSNLDLNNSMYPIAIRKNDNQNLFGKTLILLLGCYFIYLLVISGPYGYRVFWLFLYPPAAFYLLGRNLGSLFCGIFFVVALIFLLFQEHFPSVCQHNAEFKLIFLSTFFIIGLASFVFEDAKYRYQKNIKKNKMLLAQERKKVIAAEKSNISLIRAKNQFLANMSHELRTPLNHMIGFTELVVDQKFGKLNQTQREFLNDALNSSKYLFALINDILDLKRLETGKLDLLISEIDNKTFIEECLTMIRERALNHGIEISFNLDSAPTVFKADRPKLQQVMYNLLSNAAKFTPDGGLVTVIARRVELYCRPEYLNDGAQIVWTIQDMKQPEITAEFEYRTCVEFMVVDNGIGIKSADLERIFKRFEQADDSSRKKFQGTGLGLSLSKRYVELHGGRIWAESEGEGKGSTFTFVIPY